MTAALNIFKKTFFTSADYEHKYIYTTLMHFRLINFNTSFY